ncbi:ParH-like protein [Streptomyces sp. NPDC051677]|uniref:ParH-like protein n=1 Tax=Streptomyces sp. NPDC051677 TaxID=3365669 RepID=UPI0037CD5581
MEFVRWQWPATYQGEAGMDDRALLRYCAEVIEHVDVPAPYDVNALCDALEQRRQREISLTPMAMPTRPGSPCGLWIATDNVDYILYQRNTSKAHGAHIVRHEVGHMLLGHSSTPADKDEVTQLLMPSLSPDLVRTVLGRTVYSSHEERAAEMIASQLAIRESQAPARTIRRRDLAPGVANLVSHLERSLERNAGEI